MIRFLTITLLSLAFIVVANADNPRTVPHRIWADSEKLLVLQYSHPVKGGYSGTTTLLRKSDGEKLFKANLGYLTYVWISPDSEYVVGFSDSLVFTEDNGYNLIVLDASGKILHKEAIRHNSLHVPNASESVTEWVHFYWGAPDIKLEIKEGKLTAITFLNREYKRCRVPIGPSEKPKQ